LSEKKKVLCIIGTRPEAIKMAPVIKRMKDQGKSITPVVLATGQHTHMLYQALSHFGIIPDHDLGIMKENQTLDHITSEVLNGVGHVLDTTDADLVLVHGDTTTTFSSALAAFYRKIPIGHVEAGLRSWDMDLPFPEEMNRVLTDQISTLWFAPTSGARENLLSTGADSQRIFVTGNTVVDALLETLAGISGRPALPGFDKIPQNAPVILMTAHRRESWGEPLKELCLAMKDIMDSHEELWGIIPMHKNPVVRETIFDILASEERLILTEPLDYPDFVWSMERSRLILTDSGGIQEEATSLKKPVLVMRDITERPEAYENGTAILVGRKSWRIKEEALKLLEDGSYYSSITDKSANPFGDGNAANRIIQVIDNWFLD